MSLIPAKKSGKVSLLRGKMEPSLKISCQCGQLKGEILHPELLFGNHFICMCDDCQTFAHHLGKVPDVLDANGGTDIVPVHAAYLKVTDGIEKVRCVRLKENGMYRWYTGCCKTPIANTMSGKMGYYGFFVQTITTKDEKLGPVKARTLGKFGIPPLPEGTYQGTPPKMFGFILKMIIRMIVKGLRSPSPFFKDKTFEPIVTPHVLTFEELANARAQLSN